MNSFDFFFFFKSCLSSSSFCRDGFRLLSYSLFSSSDGSSSFLFSSCCRCCGGESSCFFVFSLLFLFLFFLSLLIKFTVCDFLLNRNCFFYFSNLSIKIAYFIRCLSWHLLFSLKSLLHCNFWCLLLLNCYSLLSNLCLGSNLFK